MTTALPTISSLPRLTSWQKTQAAMLYHYASLDYLKGLHRIVSDLMDEVVDPIVDLAKQQGRDSILVNERWGARDTVQNWTNNAWPFLSDFRQSLAKDMALRIAERYKITGANQCLRGLDEFSMNWTTPEEEESVQAILTEISSYSDNIDKTLQDWPSSRWDDFSFAYRYLKFSIEFPRIPKFQIRKDVQAETKKTPPRTGVYISADHTNAALQFAWVGGGGGKLRSATTFNEIGLDAFQYAGRKDLWFDDAKMLAFAMSAKYRNTFEKQVQYDGKPHPAFATTAVASAAFTEHPSTWYYVEMINDEFEDIAVVSESENDRIESPAPELLRVVGGRVCIRSGYWFTPAKSGSRRHFNEGETMPIFDSDYGSTFWQWDTEQK
jgi:hypothetical protein